MDMERPYQRDSSGAFAWRDNGYLVRMDAGDIDGYKQSIYRYHDFGEEMTVHLLRNEQGRLVFTFAVPTEENEEEAAATLEQIKWGLEHDQLSHTNSDRMEGFVPTRTAPNDPR